MLQNAILSLVNISAAVAKAPAYTQGGGGNTSVKDKDTMFIKASGFRLDEVSDCKGFVEVKYNPIQQYLLQKPTTNADNDLKAFVNNQIKGDKSFLPSMETGFHAVLKKVVIHTHPVAVNKLMCSQVGIDLIKQKFEAEDYTIIPFVNPGYYLSKAIADIGYNIPPIIFLQNHGLVVHSDTEMEAVALHQKVMDIIDLHENEHTFELNLIKEDYFELKSNSIGLFFHHPKLLANTYFPDQAVVIGNDYGFNATFNLNKKLNFITSSGQCFIKTNQPKAALAIAENLMALSAIAAYNYTNNYMLNALPIADVAYILGMDMEKYRQKLLG